MHSSEQWCACGDSLESETDQRAGICEICRHLLETGNSGPFRPEDVAWLRRRIAEFNLMNSKLIPRYLRLAALMGVLALINGVNTALAPRSVVLLTGAVTLCWIGFGVTYLRWAYQVWWHTQEHQPAFKQVIRGCEARGDGDDPYLTRYCLLYLPWGSLYFHIFHRSDADTLHDHPWNFWTLVLWRGYMEELPPELGADAFERVFGFPPGPIAAFRRRVWPGQLLYRPATHIHRVCLWNDRNGKPKPAVTLNWVSPKVRAWGFHTPAGWQYYRDYFREQGC